MNKNISFLILLLIAILNIITSYTFGSNGYEAFVTVSIALGIISSWQSVKLARLILQGKINLIIKLINLGLLGLAWSVAIGGVVLCISRSAYDPSMNIPSVSWLLVGIGTIPYLIPRLSFTRLLIGLHQTLIGTVATLYSIIVLFIAALGFYNNVTKYQALTLLLAMQLQYLMNHVIVSTDYVSKAYESARTIARRHKIEHQDLGQILTILFVGLPFALPLAIILIVTVIS